LTITNPGAVCEGTTVDLTAAELTDGSSLAETLYYYSDAAGTVVLANPNAVPTAIASADTTYYIQAESANGCRSVILPVTVSKFPAPILTITNPDAVCEGTTVDLTAAEVTDGSSLAETLYYYSDAAGTVVLANPNAVPTAIASADTTYYIQAESANGCRSAILPVTVTTKDCIPPIPPGLIPSGLKYSVCKGETECNISIETTENLSGLSYQVRCNYSILMGVTATEWLLIPDTRIIRLTLLPTAPAGVYPLVIAITNGRETEEYALTIVVIGEVTITQQPQSHLLLCGDEEQAISFSAAADSYGELSYQWYYVEADDATNTRIRIDDATESDYTVTYTPSISGRKYQVEVSNGCNTKFSDYALLQHNQLRIAQEWNDVIYVEDFNHRFVGFQWYRDGKKIDKNGYAQYYSEETGLNGVYHAECFYSDGTSEVTCPVEIVSSERKKDDVILSPNPVKANTPFDIRITGSQYRTTGTRIDIFYENGTYMGSYPVTGSITTLTAPSSTGGYLLRIITKNGSIVVRKLVVL
jgi:hypothetical protein